MGNCHCHCLAYGFPHRPGGGACETPTFVELVGGQGFDLGLADAAGWMDCFDCPYAAFDEFMFCNG